MERTDLIGPGEPDRVRWTLDLVQVHVDLPGLRVLDLACRIGSFAVAFADAGARVLAVDGRQENLDHAPEHRGVKYRLDDVRNLSVRRHGKHDVTLCLGILYHLDAEDAIRLLAAMRKVTERFAVVDTHVGYDQGDAIVGGVAYRGAVFGETPGHPWSALDNPTSWWFTEDSLDEAIRAAGWSEIRHVAGQSWAGEDDDRRWLVIS